MVVAPAAGGKRGPKTALTDDALVVEIRAVLAACPFHSEGHRKVHARLRAKAIRVGRKRVLRLMRAHHLLAPSRPRHEHGDPAHAGTIVTLRPDEMWVIDVNYSCRSATTGIAGRCQVDGLPRRRCGRSDWEKAACVCG